MVLLSNSRSLFVVLLSNSRSPFVVLLSNSRSPFVVSLSNHPRPFDKLRANGIFLSVDAQRLIGGDVDARVGGGILAMFGLDDAGVAAERSLELGVGLFAQLVTVAQKQRGLGQ